MTAESDPKALEDAAVALLARREHSRAELAGKLAHRGFERDAIEAGLDALAASGLQSDERFAEQFVAERFRRGDGPIKLRAALAERGVGQPTIEAALEAYRDEWWDSARWVLQRKFGPAGPGSVRERARRARFLQQRGFPAEIASRLTEFESIADE